MNIVKRHIVDSVRGIYLHWWGRSRHELYMGKCHESFDGEALGFGRSAAEFRRSRLRQHGEHITASGRGRGGFTQQVSITMSSAID